MALPVADNLTINAPTVGNKPITLTGSDSDGTPLTFTIMSSPSHGTLSGFSASTGAVVYTPTWGYTGADSFTYKVTSGGQDSLSATVSITVANEETRIIDYVLNPNGSARSGKVTFVLTSRATSGNGLVAAASSVSATLDSTGKFDITVIASENLSPQAYYQVYYSDGYTRELLGVYDIPVSLSAITLGPYAVSDTNLAARYTFADSTSLAAIQSAVANATFQSLLGATLSDGDFLAYSGTTDKLTAAPLNDDGSTLLTDRAIEATEFIGSGAQLTGIVGTGAGGTDSESTVSIIADKNGANAGAAIEAFTGASGSRTSLWKADLNGFDNRAGLYRRTASQINALSAGNYGRELWQTDGLKGRKRDFGSTVGFRHATPYYSAYEIGLIPNASDSTTRSANSAAWAALMSALTSRGGRIVFPEEAFYFAEDLEVNKLCTIEGSTAGFRADAVGTKIYVESGQNGFSFLNGASGASLKNMAIETRSGYSGVSTGDGVYSEVTVKLDNLLIKGFGRDGIHFRGTYPANCDFSSIKDVHCLENKRDGLHLDGGGDTNVITILNPNVYQNGRHGLYNAGGTNTIIGPHASGNAVVTSGSYDYYDDSTSSTYITLYSEGGGSAKIYLGSNSIYNTFIFGIFGGPEIVPTSPGINGDHMILDRGHWRTLRIRDRFDASGGLSVNFVSEAQHLYVQAGGIETFLDYNAVTRESEFTKLAYNSTFRASGTPQTLTGAGAVNLTSDTTLLVTTGANALTLADGAQGQIKRIYMKTDGGDGTLTPANRAGYSQIVFNDVGDTVTLQFQDSKWWIVGSYGVTIS